MTTRGSRSVGRIMAVFAFAWLAPAFMAGIGSPQGGTAIAQPAVDTSTPPPAPAEEQPEVLTSGPVHEAFAEPVTLQPEDEIVVPDQPPAPIEETPPVERPQGDQYTWVPGYWAWDSTTSNYLWVSACWRLAPPKMSWVPGYWHQVGNGWEWVAGFWAPEGSAELEYYPAPPAVEDLQPPGPPPSADRMWVPSCWYWRGGHYVLRKGYWIQPQPGWLWIPSHYTRTPRGYVFVEGHWDHPLQQRGVLFAPVRFARPGMYARFVFSPSVVVDLDVMTANLFTCTRYRHYFFGDYYDATAVKVGIVPWFDHDRIHGWYDPIFVYDRWHYRAEPGWEQRIRHDYDLRRADQSLRPTRTYRELERRLAATPEPRRKSMEMARPLSSVVAARSSPVKFERMSAESRQELSRRSDAVRNYRNERSQWESPAPVPRAAPRQAVRGRAAPPSERHPGEARELPTSPDRVRVKPSPITPGRDRQAAPRAQSGDAARGQPGDDARRQPGDDARRPPGDDARRPPADQPRR